MARIYPPEVRADTASSAERLLFQELARQLPDDYTVLHAVKWLSRQAQQSQDGEADFVLLHPDRGFLVLEVKGGLIRRDGRTGVWSSQSRSGEVFTIKDPFDQAQRSMYALNTKLRDAPATKPYTYPFARAVAFPDLLVENVQLGVNVHRDLIIDSSDLNDLTAAVNRAWGIPQQGGPGAAGVDALVSLLSPTIEIQRRGLVASIKAEHEEMLQLTQQQIHLLDSLSEYRRMAIRGVAGSGKTVLAMEQAQRLANQGFRVLFTCFNKALAAWVGAELSRDLGGAAPPIVVRTYHDLATDFARRAGIKLPAAPERLPSDEQQRYYNDHLTEHLATATATLPDRFDAIIVDEGQDFAETWWIALEQLLADPVFGVFFIFYDDNQRIYQRLGAYPIPPPHFSLTMNCRTTQRIHQAAGSYATIGTAANCLGPVGRTLESVPVSPGQEVEALRRVIHDLIEVEKIPLGDIVVLTPRGPMTSALKEGAKLGNRLLSWQSDGPNVIRCRSIHVFKGLESPVVILAEPEKAHHGTSVQLLYVALSRAQHHVVVLGQLPAGRTAPDLQLPEIAPGPPASA